MDFIQKLNDSTNLRETVDELIVNLSFKDELLSLLSKRDPRIINLDWTGILPVKAFKNYHDAILNNIPLLDDFLSFLTKFRFLDLIEAYDSKMAYTAFINGSNDPIKFSLITIFPNEDNIHLKTILESSTDHNILDNIAAFLKNKQIEINPVFIGNDVKYRFNKDIFHIRHALLNKYKNTLLNMDEKTQFLLATHRVLNLNEIPNLKIRPSVKNNYLFFQEWFHFFPDDIDLINDMANNGFYEKIPKIQKGKAIVKITHETIDFINDIPFHLDEFSRVKQEIKNYLNQQKTGKFNMKFERLYSDMKSTVIPFLKTCIENNFFDIKEFEEIIKKIIF